MAIQAQFQSDNLGLGFPLGGSQDWMDVNGCGFNEFCFNLQQKYQHQMQQQQQKNQPLFFDNSLLFSTSKPNFSTPNHHSMALSWSFEAQAEKQRQEIDQFISLQNGRLRLALQEQRRQQLAILLSKFESKTLPLLRQKEEEIAQAAKRTMELEDFLRRLEMENQGWQRVAKENEAMILSLNNTLEELREKACGGFLANGAEDAESCCDVNRAEDREEGTGENREIDNGEKQMTRKLMVCQSCNSRSSCVLFLPCRHLCSCKACEAFLDSCPVCRTGKKATIEVLIF
ncbi:probable BOI-related E3 ubiquitin-protein ligase 3 [Malania oleifera]|uniref:probable BOI-related E3 ubiquitin-protein ligase 3 n=1 Tax=Malania oleifera TaxID=397392 RepID=UPI0025ADC7FC|nr:probable BOI-related E3 ubiquitin-protein ligase 3 [Malania oleifera]